MHTPTPTNTHKTPKFLWWATTSRSSLHQNIFLALVAPVLPHTHRHANLTLFLTPLRATHTHTHQNIHQYHTYTDEGQTQSFNSLRTTDILALHTNINTCVHTHTHTQTHIDTMKTLYLQSYTQKHTHTHTHTRNQNFQSCGRAETGEPHTSITTYVNAHATAIQSCGAFGTATLDTTLTSL